MNAQVVVPSYKGPNIDSFSYEVPNSLEIKIGQLVNVPFGKRQELGLVLETSNQRPETSAYIKAIDSVVFEKPFLLPYQLELLKWMTEYYLATAGNCLNAMLPELPSSKSLIVNSKWKAQMSIHHSPFTIHQTLVLVPTINNLPQTMALFPKATRHVVYNSDLRPQEKLEGWQVALSGQADYIFGTRQAIFFPYPNLKKIIILNEHDDAYKDQRSPFSDTITIAEKISQLTRAKIQILDSAPKVATYFNYKVKIALSKKVKTKITSLVDDKLSGNKTAISYDLENAITETLEEKRRVLLFLNKKKEDGTLYCRTCKHKKTLPKEPAVCPNCGSTEIWFGSLNIGSLAKQAKVLFPNTQVNVIDQGPGTRDQGPGIDIATASVFYQLLPGSYDLVAAVSIDSALNIPEFSAPEKTYSQITNLKRLARKQFLLQTYQSENPIIQQAVDGDYATFYEAQLKERQTLSYPPFGLLIKLVFKGKNTEKVLERAEKVAEKFRNQKPETRDQENTVLATSLWQLVSILGPFEPYFKKTAPAYHVVLKIPLKSPSLGEKEKILKELKNIFNKIDAFKTADQIIVDPIGVN